MFSLRRGPNASTTCPVNALAFVFTFLHVYQSSHACTYFNNNSYGRIVPFFDVTLNHVTTVDYNLCENYHLPKTTAYVLSFTCATNATKPGGGLYYRSTPFLGYPRGKLPLLILVNLLAGDISTNPGPVSNTAPSTNQPSTKRHGRKPKWPCGICEYACNNDCIMCGNCEKWFHMSCSGASEETLNYHTTYEEAVWLCPVCDNINITSSTSDSDIEVSNYFDCLSEIVNPVMSSTPTRRRKITPIKLRRAETGWTRVNRSRSSPKDHQNQSDARNGPDSDNRQKRINKKTPKLASLNIININCNGIKGKTPQIELLLQEEKIDVILGTESKLGNDVYSAEIFPSNYRVFRRDRVSGGGGVFIAVKDNIPCYERTDLMMDDTELLWCHLTLQDQNILVGAFYRQERSKVDSLSNLSASLTSLQNSVTLPYIILGGDFNVPGINWKEDVLRAENPLQEKLLQVANDHLLTQMVPFTTRRHTNGTENVLDLLFTSHPSLLHSVRPHSGISDHSAVLAVFNTKVRITKKPPREIPLWKSVDQDAFRDNVRKLTDDFNNSQPQEKTVEENWIFFINALNDTVKQHVPHKSYSGNRGAPWFTNSLKKEN